MLFLKLLERLSVDPSLGVVVVPDRELNFEEWRLLCRLNFNHDNRVLIATVLQCLNILSRSGVSATLLKFIGKRADPNVDLIVAVKDVNIISQQALLGESWHWFHIHKARAVTNPEETRFEVVVYNTVVSHLDVTLLATKKSPKLLRFTAFFKLTSRLVQIKEGL
jgi:hypothetical protein